ncbi:FecR family protein [Steroidobacter flavus]|uniref:FecR family protein n=1 Tax=Steroidobacter flavus TaxID=1842136 RepID=A0ABV8T3P0_9GAMM
MMDRTSSAAIDAEAADWVVRLGAASLDPHEQRALEEWLATSAEHRRALEFAQSTWRVMGQVAAGTPSAEAATSASFTRSVSGPRFANRRVGRPLALAASLLVGVVALGTIRDIPWVALGADHYTRVGEVRRVELSDGSVVTLDTDSAIAVDYSNSSRRIHLLAGTAKFDVAAIDNPSERPFIVAASDGTVRALGTSFVVERQDDEVTVSVVEHSVSVELHSLPDEQVVHTGERIHYGDTLGTIDNIDPARVATWSRDRLLFDNVPLRDAVKQINRYRKPPIVVADAALADRLISGLFRLDELDRAVDMIATELGARTANVPAVVTLMY